MSAFDHLHPALQHHIVNSLGWASLRPLQEATIEPVLCGEHAILLAPTAGGKTEAAIFPVLSRMLSENWRGLSVLYVCPIKALLNNLEPRLAHYAGLLGRRVGLWHGDISPSRKAKMAGDPPDILLTTPESLEVMLVSTRIDHWRLFADLRCVIIDEVHAFAGDDRGWHLLYVLERLSHIAGREIQRLGLSATVGNPQALCDWLAEGWPSPRSVINPPAEGNVEPEVEIDWVGNLDNAALVISRLHRGEKRLVFCDSRSRVEELAMRLRNLKVNTFVSHSCLSLEERRAAEQAFAQGENCVIVATSTLELGIDVGDLDRVIQIDAPASVSSFLQRIGRTGRRTGSSRNCLFLATKPEAFLQGLALMQLWSEGYVEPIEPPALPLHIFAQQIMALTLQEKGIGIADWPKWYRRFPGLRQMTETQMRESIEYMIESGILHSDQGMLGIGEAGERHYGRKNFMELLSVFTSPPLVRVYHGKQEIGEVHQTTFAIKDDAPPVLTLGGRTWRLKHLDWSSRRAYVEPTDLHGRSQWLSGEQPLGFELCQAIPRVLCQEPPPVQLSQRGKALLEELKEQYEGVTPQNTLLMEGDDGRLTWWTFAGKIVNAALGQSIAPCVNSFTIGDLYISLSGNCIGSELADCIIKSLKNAGRINVSLDEKFVAELKFSECLSGPTTELVLCSRYNVENLARVITHYPITNIHS